MTNLPLSFLDHMNRMQAYLRTSPSERAFYALAQRDREDKQAELQDKAAVAALAGRPERTRYYEEWVDRV